MKKRILSLLLALVMVLSLLPAAAFAAENAPMAIPESASAVRENPLYSDSTSASATVSKEAKKSLEAWAAASADTTDGPDADGYYYDLDEIHSILANYMVNRTEEFELDVRLDSCYVYTNDLLDIVYLLFEESMAHNGIPNQGDYLQWVYGWVSYGYYGAYTYNGYYYLTLTYTVSYYTNAAQEAAVTEKLNQVMPSFGFTNTTDDYTKVKTIYQYLCDNITYDYDHPDDYMLQYTAYAGLINGTCVCQGYAVLFYRMALMAGVDARVVTGIGNGGPHAWNIVQVGPYYYNLDSTWDAGYPEDWWDWFLLNDSNFHNTYPYHTREYPYSSEEFCAQYPIGSSNYTYTTFDSYATFSWGTLYYSVKGGCAYLTGYSGTQSTATVPATLNGYPVISVGNVFANCTNLKTIYFEGEAPAISAHAFSGVTATCYYPCGDDSWFFTVMEKYDGNITWQKSHDFEDGQCQICGEKVSAPVVKLSIKADSGKPYLDWEPVAGAVKYEVYRATSKNGNYTKMLTTTNTYYTNTSATPSTTYYYKVRAVSADGSVGAYSTIKSITCDCAAPVITLTVKADSGKPSLTWKAVEGATKYEVYRATSKNGSYSKMYTTSGTSYINSTANPGTTYYYKVRALGKSEYATSAYSTIKSITCDCAAPVVKLTTKADSGKPYLDWEPVTGAVKYEVYRATSKSGTYSKMLTTTNTYYTNTTAKPGTTYYYKVRALGSTEYANSAYSTIKSITCDCARPVVKLSIKADSGKPYLDWEPVAGAVKYEVYRATSKNGTYTKMLTTTNTYYTNTSATPGTTYYYKVKAIGSTEYANSAYSTVKSITCDCARPVVTISRNNGKPYLDWEPVAGAVKYEIYRATSKDGNYTKMYTTTSTYYTNTSAVAGTTYYYKVRAIGSTEYANSAYSVVKSITSK